MTLSELEWFLSIRNQVRSNLHNSQEFTFSEAKKWWLANELNYWIIEMNDQKLGYFRLIRMTPAKLLIGADIDPNFQGKGFGYLAYVNFAKQVLVNENCELLELRVLKKNLRARKLYKKLGFKIIEETEIDYMMQVDLNELLSIS